MNEKETNNGIAIAALKLSVIQPAFNGTFPDMSKKTITSVSPQSR